MPAAHSTRCKASTSSSTFTVRTYCWSTSSVQAPGNQHQAASLQYHTTPETAVPHPLALRTCIWSTSSMQAVEEPRMPSSRNRLAANCNAKRGRQACYNQEPAVHSQPCNRHSTAGVRPAERAVAPDAGTRPAEQAVGCEQCAPTCSTRSTSVVPRSTECRANSIMRRLQEQCRMRHRHGSGNNVKHGLIGWST